VVIPKSVTVVGNSFASSCHSLTSVVIPQGVITINDRAFGACYCLKNAIIPKSVTTIGGYVFSQCYALPGVVVIPQGVAVISDRIFDSCYSVVKYDFTQYTTIPTLNSSVFAGINRICKIYVPDNLYDEWIVATNWASFIDYIYKASEMEVSDGQ
jgi:hypothetical protein